MKAVLINLPGGVCSSRLVTATTGLAAFELASQPNKPAYKNAASCFTVYGVWGQIEELCR